MQKQKVGRPEKRPEDRKEKITVRIVKNKQEKIVEKYGSVQKFVDQAVNFFTPVKKNTGE